MSSNIKMLRRLSPNLTSVACTRGFFSFPSSTPKAALSWKPYRKHVTSPWRTVPTHIVPPPYAKSGKVGNSMNNPVELKNPEQIAAMRKACVSFVLFSSKACFRSCLHNELMCPVIDTAI
jgi:hypothetical protein